MSCIKKYVCAQKSISGRFILLQDWGNASQKKERKEIGLKPHGQLGECFTAGSLFWAGLHSQIGGLVISVEDIHCGSVALVVSNSLPDWSGGNKGVIWVSRGPKRDLQFLPGPSGQSPSGVMSLSQPPMAEKATLLKASGFLVHSGLQLVVWSIRCWQMGGRTWDAVGNQWFIAWPGTLNGV